MRTALLVLAVALALALPAGDLRAAGGAPKRKVVTVTERATSPLVAVSRWGELQVTIEVEVTTTTVGTRKTRRLRITDIRFPVYPDHSDRSAFISSQALPLLRQEVLELRGTTIQLVSGATDTSYGFVEALRAALAKIK